MIKNCKLCNKEFLIKNKNKREINKIFCTVDCARKYNGLSNKGRKRSEEQKEQIKLRTKGENNPFYGKKHTLETKKKISESNKWPENKYKYANLNKDHFEILDGIMLSDGCLSDKSRISARLTFGFKYKNVCKTIINQLNSLTFSPINKNEKTSCYHSKSHYFHDLLKENKRWYLNNKKIIPNDIKVTKKSCYWWYIGDGYISNNNVYLCTECFSKKENLFLIEKLKEKNFKVSLTSRNRLRFFKKDSINFLNWIESNKIKEYNYKWEIKEK